MIYSIIEPQALPESFFSLSFLNSKASKMDCGSDKQMSQIDLPSRIYWGLKKSFLLRTSKGFKAKYSKSGILIDMTVSSAYLRTTKASYLFNKFCKIYFLLSIVEITRTYCSSFSGSKTNLI